MESEEVTSELADLLEQRKTADPETRRRLQAKIRRLQDQAMPPEERKLYREQAQDRMRERGASHLRAWLMSHDHLPETPEEWDEAHEGYLAITGWAPGEARHILELIDGPVHPQHRAAQQRRVRELRWHLSQLARHLSEEELTALAEHPVGAEIVAIERTERELAAEEAARERVKAECRQWVEDRRDEIASMLLEPMARATAAGIELPTPGADAVAARVRELMHV